MYTIKKDFNIKLNKKVASEEIGITRPALTNILNGRVACRKVVAFSIVKYIDLYAEIEDYFDEVKGK